MWRGRGTTSPTSSTVSEVKRALVVGIDYYDQYNALGGCVNDARALHPLLARNEDVTVNLDCRIVTASDPPLG